MRGERWFTPGTPHEEPVMPLPLLYGCLILLLTVGCAGAPHSANTPSSADDVAAESVVQVDPPSSPEWATDMARFDAQDAASKPPQDAFVFTGSSSVRMWDTLATDFPGKPLLNRGFGGSQLRDSVHYAQQIAVRYQPRMILLYAGDNDINAGRTPQQVLHDFRAFVARVRRDLPDTPIAFLAIKPSPSRAQQLPRQQQANALVQAEASRLHKVEFIDVATPMLGADGQPRAELFIEDQLHMNHAGYALWRDIVAPYLR
jgi:lysophospholipase L1-like esterase